jgi:hypothetical protein
MTSLIGSFFCTTNLYKSTSKDFITEKLLLKGVIWSYDCLLQRYRNKVMNYKNNYCKQIILDRSVPLASVGKMRNSR